MSKSTNIVKLSNGENLICNVVSDTDKHIEIESPLKMETISRVTKTGVVESLSLGKWMQLFSDQKTISLNKNIVIINLPVTIGLEKYYEYVLKKMDLGDGPSEEELKAIEEEEKQDLKDQMLEYIKDDVTKIYQQVDNQEATQAVLQNSIKIISQDILSPQILKAQSERDGMNEARIRILEERMNRLVSMHNGIHPPTATKEHD